MADLTFSRTTQQMTASSFSGLFGLFAGLCAIFAGCVTVSDWYSETTKARWPVVSAVIDGRRRCYVASAKGRRWNGMEPSLSRAVRAERQAADRNADIEQRIFGS
jgi:hypothetical protein